MPGICQSRRALYLPLAKHFIEEAQVIILSKSQTARQSNVELLRIVAMIMIIAHHIGVHSNFDLSGTMPAVNRLWISWIQMGGKIGVNIFVLISGYFLITTDSLKLSKVAKLWVQLCTYSVGLYVLCAVLGAESFSLGTFLGRFFPVSNSSWWFARTYFILFLISPFLNAGLKALTQKAYLRLLLLLTVCWSLFPTIFSDRMESNSLLWFIYLYALAGYIRLHFDVHRVSTQKWLALALIAAVLTYIGATVLYNFGVASVFDPYSSGYAYDMQQISIVVISVSLFCGFVSKDLRNLPAVNIISSATFGVYLLHDYGPMRTILWQWIFKNNQYATDSLLILYTLLQIVVVFIGCAAIELARIYLIERKYMKRIDAMLTKRKQ